ncbi:MAG: hypothetical protein HY698_11125 [Deltaproteobacteria bacterium]|nr:hypothetical protein [Deltaproteobacteria bacterium]
MRACPEGSGLSVFVSLMSVFTCGCLDPFSPEQPSCLFLCGRGGACPSGYQCGDDNRCHLVQGKTLISCEELLPTDAIAVVLDALSWDAQVDAVVDGAPDSSPDVWLECKADSDCGTSDECATRACSGGKCAVTFSQAGHSLAAQTAGDCRRVECDGAGEARSTVDNSDLPDDGNPCTSDSCAAGMPTHSAVAGRPCSQGGGRVCAAEGKCVECLVPLDCPWMFSECSFPTCQFGACGVGFVAAGADLSSQAAGDCKVKECNGEGGSVQSVDDNDVQVDGNSCTRDVCIGGTPYHPPALARTSCSQDGGVMCDGEGRCVKCLLSSDCPGTDTECAVRSCVSGACGMDFTASGAPVTGQTTGDCKVLACDGTGKVVSKASDSDIPVDGLACTADTCKDGLPSNPPKPVGTACSEDTGVMCDGEGNCAQCVFAANCPGTDTECAVRSCRDGTCGVDYTTAGTPTTAQVPGDCHVLACDGGGGVTSKVDDGDVPVDGIACTADACKSGVPSNPPKPSGTTCSEGGGVMCDGAGKCVQCLTVADCPGVDTECAARTCTTGTCGVEYAALGTTVTAQVPGDCHLLACDGKGSVASVVDDTDIPSDGNECTVDECTSGTPSHSPKPVGAPCAAGCCDGTGGCGTCK